MSASHAMPGRSATGYRRALAVLGVAAALGGAAYLLASAWQALTVQPQSSADADAGCDLNAGPCAVSFDEARFIRLEIAPRPVPATQPLRLLIDTGGIAADEVRVEFSGVDMNMGLLSVPLLDVGGGSFAGDATLPVCVRRRMTWRATVIAEGEQGIHRAGFVFDAGVY